jgi:rubrerythrin
VISVKILGLKLLYFISGSKASYAQNPNISIGLEIDNTTGVRYLNPSCRLPQSGHNGVDAGTKCEYVPGDQECPVCGASKNDLEKED